MNSLIVISFILSLFPLVMGFLSLPILSIQEFVFERKLNKEELLVQQEKDKAWFYGLWLPTAIWTIAFIIYKFWTYMSLDNVSLVEPLDHFSGIFFVIFYLLFHWGHLAFSKKEDPGKYKTYDSSQVFKVVFSILLLFVFALLFSLCSLLIQLRS